MNRILLHNYIIILILLIYTNIFNRESDFRYLKKAEIFWIITKHFKGTVESLIILLNICENVPFWKAKSIIYNL